LVTAPRSYWRVPLGWRLDPSKIGRRPRRRLIRVYTLRKFRTGLRSRRAGSKEDRALESTFRSVTLCRTSSSQSLAPGIRLPYTASPTSITPRNSIIGSPCVKVHHPHGLPGINSLAVSAKTGGAHSSMVNAFNDTNAWKVLGESCEVGPMFCEASVVWPFLSLPNLGQHDDGNRTE